MAIWMVFKVTAWVSYRESNEVIILCKEFESPEVAIETGNDYLPSTCRVAYIFPVSS
jgi:hypothetical protein